MPERDTPSEGTADPHQRRIRGYRHRGGAVAKYFETEVTAVCSRKNLELVRSVGAYRVIDYTREDFTSNVERYDVIFDAVGKLSFRRCTDSLKHGGINVGN